MKILFLLYFDIHDKSQAGVGKKINYQVKAMKSVGHMVDLGYCKNDLFIIERDNKKKTIPIRSGYTHYRYGVFNLMKKIGRYYDLVFIRYPGSIDYYLYKTIKTVSKWTDVILELPTYPIGGEMKDILLEKWKAKQYLHLVEKGFVYGLHKIYSRRLYRYLSCIVSYSDYEIIWNTKVVNIENGIDCESILTKKKKTDGNGINFIMVAVFSKWHGIDRMIQGMQLYYKNRKKNMPDVTLTLVGESEELENIKKSKAYNEVKQHIRCVGSKFGEELDKEYDNATLAISSLGMHRIGLRSGSTLKTREYCAKGIPFVYGYHEKGLDDNFPYAIRVPADDTPLDLEKIIEYYDQIKEDDYINYLRDFSKRYDWENQIRLMFEGVDPLLKHKSKKI